tara:strand:+ start:206 stop:400 length:195 start_codon:yes stop_codon:yes gene_type:complete
MNNCKIEYSTLTIEFIGNKEKLKELLDMKIFEDIGEAHNTPLDDIYISDFCYEHGNTTEETCKK